ncbi:hypothetical protein [Paenibacillus sp. FSL R5-0470]|uniref:hypothetical protein n=1 Tax=Paenibacillus sp. FSL R5-0470 TaxID=2921641 RepID=UPI0030DB3CA7
MRSGDAKHRGSSEYRHRKHTLRSQPFRTASRSGQVTAFLREGCYLRSGDAKHRGSSEYRHRKHTLRSQPFRAASRSGLVNSLPSGRLLTSPEVKIFGSTDEIIVSIIGQVVEYYVAGPDSW